MTADKLFNSSLIFNIHKMKTTAAQLLITVIFLFCLQGYNTRHVNLTTSNFKQHFGCDLQNYLTCTQSPKRDWFIMFMAPWCGHCRNAKPTFLNFASMQMDQIVQSNQQKSQSQIYTIIQNSLQFAIVDCDQQRPLCHYFNTKGFPTFIYLTADKKAVQYVGPRNVQSFKNFTFYHDPDQQHINCKHAKIAHSQWADIWEQTVASVKQYWWQLILFSIVIPSIIGYLIGQCVYGKRNPTPTAQVSSKQNGASQPGQNKNKNQ